MATGTLNLTFELFECLKLKCDSKETKTVHVSARCRSFLARFAGPSSTDFYTKSGAIHQNYYKNTNLVTLLMDMLLKKDVGRGANHATSNTLWVSGQPDLLHKHNIA